MMNLMNQKNSALLLIFSFSIGILSAQLARKSPLFQTLQAKDSLLFSVGFNTCDLEQIDELVSADMEFFHDKGGIDDSKPSFMAGLKQNLCSTGKSQAHRILDKNSLEVFPLYKGRELYGAIQKGIHFFGLTQARFTHLWLLEKEEWKLSRVLSYDHKEVRRATYDGLDFIEINPHLLQRYLGEYQFSPEFVLSIEKEGDQLFGNADGQKVPIKAYAQDGFLSTDKSTKLDFELNDQGQVIALRMSGPNGEMNARKLE